MVPRKELMNKNVFYSFWRQDEIEQKLDENGFEIMSSIVEELDERYVTVFARKKEKTDS